MNNIFNNNKILWLLSIIVAVFLWIYVTTDENPKLFDNINNIPVELTNIESLEEKGLVISDSQEYFINIRVYGRRNQLFKVSKETIKVEADLSRLGSKGTHYLPVTINGVPEDIEISNKNPEAIEIVLDEIVTQERSVKINIAGSPAEGMAYLSYVLNPSKVTLEGAEGILNNVRDIVATVDISNANGEINRKVPLRALNSEGKKVEGIAIAPERVDVSIPIRPTKSVPIETQITGEIPEGYVVTSVEVEPSEITIAANSQQLRDVGSISTKDINVEGQNKSFEKEMRLLLPQGVEAIGSEGAVMVKVTIEPYLDRAFETTNINVINLNEELMIQEDIVDEPITFTLRGIKNRIEALQEESISVYLDALDLQEGQHEVSLKIDPPQDFTVESIEPNLVTIHIQGKAQ